MDAQCWVEAYGTYVFQPLQSGLGHLPFHCGETSSHLVHFQDCLTLTPPEEPAKDPKALCKGMKLQGMIISIFHCVGAVQSKALAECTLQNTCEGHQT